MDTRKKPGPHPENPLRFDLRARADQGTMDELQYCQDKLNLSRSETLRKAIHTLYEELVEK